MKTLYLIGRTLCFNPSNTPNNVIYENVTYLEIIQLKDRNSNNLAQIGKLANQISIFIDLESHIFQMDF